MISNIGSMIAYASQNEKRSAASQIYLWCISRVDMNKFVHRSIVARHTSNPVKMVIAEFSRFERLQSGMSIISAINTFDVCQMLSRMFEGTFVYTRRKPTDTGLSRNIHQLVMVWNGHAKYPKSVEPYHESIMRGEFAAEESRRVDDKLTYDRVYWEEYKEEMHERWADEQQCNAMEIRNMVITPVSFD